MLKLTHFRLCPLSRSIRLALAERDLAFELAEERAWEWRAGFLALNPAGELPVLEIEPGVALCGVYSIAEYLAEGEAATRPTGAGRLVSGQPRGPGGGAPARRLVPSQVRPRGVARVVGGEGPSAGVAADVAGRRMGHTPSPTCCARCAPTCGIT